MLRALGAQMVGFSEERRMLGGREVRGRWAGGTLALGWNSGNVPMVLYIFDGMGVEGEGEWEGRGCGEGGLALLVLDMRLGLGTVAWCGEISVRINIDLSLSACRVKWSVEVAVIHSTL